MTASSGAMVRESEYKFSMPLVIGAASAGTMIEWYDFYLFGSLLAILTGVFYPPGDPVFATLAFWATFAAGFIVRPFGAVIFGRVGDLIGRKYTFLVTMSLMGISTLLIGLLPGYAQIGLAAPLILLALRLLQGLAIGGEYGGAATYVAEHAPDNRRGYYTSFIQTTATLGLFSALLVILGFRSAMGVEAFTAYGWRIPFILSLLLLGMSFYIRLKLKESPLFARLKEEGKTSKNPTRESFGSGKNWRLILLALFGATAGQGVVWYTGQFYANSFLQSTMKLDLSTASIIIVIALAIGTPFFIVFGRLSDSIGRKPIMLTGMALAALLYIPIYMLMFNNATNYPLLVACVLLQVLFVTMAYGPIAAFLVEFFPAKIRYSSMSLPYHIGNGVFGGTVPYAVTWIAVLPFAQGNPYVGLVWPIFVAALTVVIGFFFLPETHKNRIWDEVGGELESVREAAGEAPTAQVRPASA